MKPILITPVPTEKAYGLTAQNTYVFTVPLDVNKQQIAETVAAEYNVEVKGVSTLVQNGKSVRFSRGKNRYPGTTTRKDSKKAYVTLKAGSSIQVFEEAEQPATSEKESK